MSSATFSVSVTKFDVGKFSSDFGYTVDPKVLASAANALADSPDTALDEVDLDLAAGLVDIPGSESDIPLCDIPIEISGAESDIPFRDIPIELREHPVITDMPLDIQGEDMLISVCASPVGGMETVSTEMYQSPCHKSNCSSPENSNVDSSQQEQPGSGQPLPWFQKKKEFDHMYASLGRNDNVYLIENLHMKEMLVCHLDLIQHQSGQIISRDKELKELRMEVLQLRQRLMRMERRVKDPEEQPANKPDPGGRSTPVLTPPKSDSKSKKRSLDRSDKLSKENTSKKRKVEEESSGKVVDFRENEEGETSRRRDRERRRESRNNLLTKTQENDSFAQPQSQGNKDSGERVSEEVKNTNHVMSEKEPVNDDLEPGDKASKKGAVQKTRTVDATQVNNVINVEQSGEDGDEMKNSHLEDKLIRRLPESVSVGDGDLLHSSYLYHVGCKNEYKSQEELSGVASLQRGVEVPRWRIIPEFEALPIKTKFVKSKEVPEWRHKPMHPAYTMEGTENIEDDTILKRHARHEHDEKRRKRWDIQRMRQAQQLEKLKASEARRSKKDKKGRETESLISYLPAPEEITHLMVSDTVPISAFGVPLPNLPQAPFSLPWLDGATGDEVSVPQKKSTRH